MSTPRRFIRHTVDVPIEVRPDGMEDSARQQGLNVSSGGLAFIYNMCPADGAIVQIRIPTVKPPFEARARVVWCRPQGDEYLVGVEFLEASDTFRIRMVEQVCAVEQYRQQVARDEGRTLSPQDAAAEWIRKYANRFP